MSGFSQRSEALSSVEVLARFQAAIVGGSSVILGSTGLPVRNSATQDAITLLGRAGGTSSFQCKLTPAVLSATRTVTFPDASFTVAGLEIANVFPVIQTIDFGSGSLPTPLADVFLRLAGPTGSNRILAENWGSTALNLSSRGASGTRASPTATGVQRIFQASGFGHNGTAYTTSPAVTYKMEAGSVWSGTSNEAYHAWDGTSAGSVTSAEWMRLQNACLALGGFAPTAGNGLLQFPSTGTTKAGGIGWGDVFLHRAASGHIFETGPAATDINFSAQRSTGETVNILAGSGVCVVQTTSNHQLWLRTNGTLALSIDTSQNVAHQKAIADQSQLNYVAVNAATYTIPDGVSTQRVSGSVTTLTIKLPATPINGQIVRMAFNATITTLTISANAGQALGPGSPTTIAPGATASYLYDGGGSTWYLIGKNA